MRRFDLWMGRQSLAFWRWQYHHPDLAPWLGWALAAGLCVLAALLAMALPDRGLLVR